MKKRSSFVSLFLLLGLVASFAQLEPQGILVLRTPSTSYTETLEYRSYRVDNALFATVVTTSGQRKQLKSASVVAAVPYPPSNFDASLEGDAQSVLEKIDALKAAHPQVRNTIGSCSGSVVARPRDLPTDAAGQGNGSPGSPPAKPGARICASGSRLSRASVDSATITHATGVTTIPLRALSAGQILSLNATSRTVQLPLNLEGASAASPTPQTGRISSATKRIEMAGRKVIAFAAKKLGVADTTFSVWTFFVAFPVLILALLIATFLMAWRPRTTLLPARRPLSPS